MKFEVVIVDESHTVKNSQTAASINLQEIVKSVPFRWAASATTVANTPARHS
jgi:SNF2 family DNA or RNA helicase